MFISVTCCEEIAKKLFENFCVKIQPSMSPEMDFYRAFSEHSSSSQDVE